MNVASVTRSLSLAVGLSLFAMPLAAQTYRTNTVEDISNKEALIVQTNSASEELYLIDPTNHEVVGVIKGILANHGAVLHAEGNRYYVTNEHDNTVDVVDARSLEIVKQIPLAARPNNLSGSDAARKVYVAISGAPLVQVISMDTDEIIESIPVPGGVHNTFVTPDGRFAVAGMIGARTVSVIDTETDEIVWDMEFDGGVRPFTFDTWPDGSTRRMFVQITDWHGFYVVDWNSRELVDKVSPPSFGLNDVVADGIQGAPSHGAVVLPDQSALWISSRATASVFGYTLPDLEFIGRVPLGNAGWLTATPDSRYVYVGVPSHNETVVVDVQNLRVVKRIPVGQAPKRVYTAVFPDGVVMPAGFDRPAATGGGGE